jgi:hypothetical protein
VVAAARGTTWRAAGKARASIAVAEGGAMATRCASARHRSQP